MSYVIDDFNVENENYGKKGDNLKKLKELFTNEKNVIVPETIILTCSLYEKVLRENQGINFMDYNQINIDSQLKELILKSIHEKFGDKKLVIRSSATCEDSVFFSASGQYDSFLNINGNDKIIDAIRKVYASLFSKNSQLYSQIYNIDLAKESMAVLIQPVAPVVKSGVMFSCDPTNCGKKYIIESTQGLGTNVVEGKGQITNMEIAYQDKEKIIDREIKELIEIIDKIKKAFGYDVDIEWGIDKDGKIYIFQARPIIHRKSQINTNYPDESVVKKGITISEGFGIGKISRITNPQKGTFLYQDKETNMNDIELLLSSRGVILKNGAKLSHFSNVLRELSKPCLYAENFEYTEGKVYAINAFNGDIIDFDKLETKEKINMLRDYFNYQKSIINHSFEIYNGITDIYNDDKYEQVVFDIDEEKILDLLKTFGFKKEVINQSIYTFDLPDKSMIMHNTIFRIQVSNGKTQIQLKTLDTSNETYRAEKGIIIHFDSLKRAMEFMNQYNMINTGFQERVITKYIRNDICINIIKWPGCAPYLGIEVKHTEDLETIKKMFDLENALITNWGGKQIFEKLNLDLKECKFKKVRKK